MSIRVGVCLLALVGIAPPVAAQLDPAVAGLLTPRTVQADVLEQARHPDVAVLNAKVMEAVGRDGFPGFLMHVATGVRARPGASQPGVPPFRAEFGLTEAEFVRYVALRDSSSFEVTGKVELELRTTDAGAMLVVPNLPLLNGARIEFSTGVVETAQGTLPDGNAVQLSREMARAPFLTRGGWSCTWACPGGFDGVHWTRLGGPPAPDVERETMALGFLLDDGRALLIYEYGRGPRRTAIALRF